MRKLFFKIYLSVLAAVLLAFGFGIYMADWLRPGPRDSDPQEPAETSQGAPQEGDRQRRGPRGRTPIDEQAEIVQRHLEANDLAGAKEALRSFGAVGVKHYLLDESGVDVFGRAVPPEIREVAQQERPRIRRGREGRFIVVRRIEAEGQPPRVLAAEVDWDAYWAWRRTRMRLLQLAPIVVALGIVCFLLARYITKPVLALRVAVRRFAQGDLAERIGAALGRRKDELGELGRDFDRMAERIASLLATQQRLLQDISHELRSPLARQVVALELARQRSGPEARSALDRAEREAQRLDQLVGEILTLTRLADAGATFSPESFALDRLLDEVVQDADFEARAQDRSVRLVESVSCRVAGVPELLRRAFENVIRNAVRYTPAGKPVEVGLASEGDAAIVRVRDYGPGVPAAELTEIFRPFYRVQSARERQTGGAGLGLAIADRALRAHGGSASAQNAGDGGLVVELRIPQGQAGEAPPHAIP